LKQHSKFANEEIYYFDEKQNKKIIPLVIEPSVGVERLFYAICCDKYDEEQLGDNEKRIVMHFPYNLSPYKVAVLPLVNKLKEKSLNIFKTIIKNNISAIFDSSGSIGRRYRRQDEIGTYFSITIDYETLNDEMVTIRHRDTMKQERIKIADIFTYLEKKKIING
jgi:glycyl-tRNA synthetase